MPRKPWEIPIRYTGGRFAEAPDSDGRSRDNEGDLDERDGRK